MTFSLRVEHWSEWLAKALVICASEAQRHGVDMDRARRRVHGDDLR